MVLVLPMSSTFQWRSFTATCGSGGGSWSTSTIAHALCTIVSNPWKGVRVVSNTRATERSPNPCDSPARNTCTCTSNGNRTINVLVVLATSSFMLWGGVPQHTVQTVSTTKVWGNRRVHITDDSSLLGRQEGRHSSLILAVH